MMTLRTCAHVQSDKDKREWLEDLRSMAAALEETLDLPYALPA